MGKRKNTSTIARQVYDLVIANPLGINSKAMAVQLDLGEQTVRQITSNLRSLGLIEIETRGVPGRMGCFGFCRPTSARIVGAK